MTVHARKFLVLAFSAALLLPGKAAALEQAELVEMEELLRDLGFNPGPVDGVVDTDTTEAIRRYQDFAVLPGDPQPSARLLDELRGVAAAFAALKTDKGTQKAAPQIPEPGAGTPAEPPTPEAESGPPQPAAEKMIVPPPAPPPKLSPPAESKAAETAETPPPEAEAAEPSEETAPSPAVPQQEAALPAAPEGDAAAEADPAAEARARIEAELAPYREELENGSLSRAELARRFNAEGRQALRQSRYDEAVLKLSVAIHLDPDFAGAYSNRGTAYQQQDQAEPAAEDFAKARELGFGGLRVRDGSNPFN